MFSVQGLGISGFWFSAREKSRRRWPTDRDTINGILEQHDLLMRADREPAHADRQVLSSMRHLITSGPMVTTPKSPLTVGSGIGVEG